MQKVALCLLLGLSLTPAYVSATSSSVEENPKMLFAPKVLYTFPEKAVFLKALKESPLGHIPSLTEKVILDKIAEIFGGKTMHYKKIYISFIESLQLLFNEFGRNAKSIPFIGEHLLLTLKKVAKETAELSE